MEDFLKQSIICLSLFIVMVGCHQREEGVVVLGSASSSQTWVYLGGLTKEIDSGQEPGNREVLNQIGKKLNIRFLAIPYFDRCEKAGNKLCWPHYTQAQALETYDKILNSVRGEKISGFIGFSNGGFFLNQLAQIQELNHPIISIGAAGSLNPSSSRNTLTLIVGKSEVIYQRARKFFKDGKDSSLSLTMIEHEGEHILPHGVLEKLMKKEYAS
jgi:hypothetical protein